MIRLKSDEIIANRFTGLKVLGAGAFGVVFKCLDTESGKIVAMKTEAIDIGLLKSERQVLQGLRGKEHFPEFIAYGEEPGRFRYIVMELVGETLLASFQRCNKKFKESTICRVAIQVFDALKSLHEVGYCHRDLKPENLAIGLGNRSREIIVLDFGLSSHVTPNTIGQSGFAGTIKYASIYAHKRQQPGFRDDSISLMYVLSEFANGRLPWDSEPNDESYAHMIKEGIAEASLFGSISPEFAKIWRHVKALKRMERPLFDQIFTLIRTVQERQSFTNDGPFEWDGQPTST